MQEERGEGSIVMQQQAASSMRVRVGVYCLGGGSSARGWCSFAEGLYA